MSIFWAYHRLVSDGAYLGWPIASHSSVGLKCPTWALDLLGSSPEPFLDY